MVEQEVRTILAPLINDHMLLPNSVIAEILGYTQPEPFRKAPHWLLGELAWNGWQVPIVCFEQIIDKRTRSSVTSKSRILIIKTLGESTQVNYIGLLVQGLPRLTRITPDTLTEVQTSELHAALFSKVSVDGVQAMIPELGELTLTVEQAAYGS